LAFLRIPAEHQVGLVKLQALSDSTASQLLSALASAAEEKQSANLSPEDLAPIEGLPKDQLEQILDALSGIHHARAYAETPLDEFVNNVSETMRSADNALPTAESAIQQFEERIKRFMDIPALARAAKGDILRYEHERTVHDLRIVTDARPIFGNSVEQPPEAFAIVHTLKIAYHRSGRIEEEFFSFDEFDLEDLREAVERAELKARSLRAALNKSGLQVLREV